MRSKQDEHEEAAGLLVPLTAQDRPWYRCRLHEKLGPTDLSGLVGGWR
jgi:hypothetical protein